MTEKIQETEIKKTRLRLSERLKLVASFVPEGSRIADIGTDHGYVPIYLAELEKFKSALAMDVRKGPLARADEHIEDTDMTWGCSYFHRDPFKQRTGKITGQRSRYSHHCGNGR